MAADSEVIRILRDLIRFDTSNPPGNERPAVDYVARLLQAENIPFEIVESAPGRANLVARLKGRGTKSALLLSAHLDVVAALGEWKHPPFAAEVHDGYVWGRGAVDMKHMAAMSLTTLLNIKRSGAVLERDLVFAAVADEEAGGKLGAGYLVDHYPELIKAGHCLTELGGMSVHSGSKVLIPVQTAQKGYVWFRLRAKGQGGHGSRPAPGSAVERLAEAALKLSKAPLRYRLAPAAKRFLESLASGRKGVPKAIIKGLMSPRTAALSLKLMPEERRLVIGAMLHDTAAVTVLSAGVKVNLVPPCAEAQVDGRYLPGQTQEGFLKQVKDVIGPDIEIEVFEGAPPVEYEAQGELWEAITRVMARELPGCEVVPYLIPGMTDAKDYARAGIVTYGFAPVALEPDEPFAALYHAPDERVSIKGVETGMRWLSGVVHDFCAAQ